MAPIETSRPEKAGGYRAIITCIVLADEELLLVITIATWREWRHCQANLG